MTATTIDNQTTESWGDSLKSSFFSAVESAKAGLAKAGALTFDFAKANALPIFFIGDLLTGANATQLIATNLVGAIGGAGVDIGGNLWNWAFN